MTTINRRIQKNVHPHPANTILISEGDMTKKFGAAEREGLTDIWPSCGHIQHLLEKICLWEAREGQR